MSANARTGEARKSRTWAVKYGKPFGFWSGIEYTAGARGTLDGNTCNDNKAHGILVAGAGTRPLIRRNTARRNTHYGIAWRDGARPNSERTSILLDNGMGRFFVER